MVAWDIDGRHKVKGTYRCGQNGQVNSLATKNNTTEIHNFNYYDEECKWSVKAIT